MRARLLMLFEAGKTMEPSVSDPGAIIWYLTDMFSICKIWISDVRFRIFSRFKIEILQRFHYQIFAAVLINFKFSDRGK